MNNKLLSVLVLGVMLLSMVSAHNVLVTGKIYDNDFTDEIADATVTVTCGESVQTTTSLSDGAYKVIFTNSETVANQVCDIEDSLAVDAVKGSLYGHKEGTIHDLYDAVGFDLSVVNVPLVPEFSFFAGTLTILSAVGIFFFVRKK